MTDEGTYIVTNIVAKNESDVVIPEKYKGISVTRFNDSYEVVSPPNNKIRSLSIPGSIKYVGGLLMGNKTLKKLN